MIHPTRDQFPTTAMEIASHESRRIIASESINPLVHHEIICTNPNAVAGMRHYIVTFTHESSVHTFDGHSWK